MPKEAENDLDLDLLMWVNAQHREVLQRISNEIKAMESQLDKFEKEKPLLRNGRIYLLKPGNGQKVKNGKNQKSSN